MPRTYFTPLARWRTEETGFTLIELLVAMSLGIILVSAVALFADVGIRSQHSTAKATEALNEQRTGLERMTREIRQATQFELVNSQVVDMNTYVNPSYGSTAVLRRVRYDCSRGELCRRSEGPVNGAFTTTDVEIVSVVQNADVFDPQPDINPTYVAVALRVRAEGDGSNPEKIITLRDGVTLRNRRQ